jgi:subtilisin family serine protease
MAKAINYAVAPDGQTVRLKAPVDVISISMGGLPSFALYKAVKAAEANGVLLVAAAGNHVRLVVWPARFDRAIAVAATNVECATWPGSSSGGAVDISAPGESVWKADVAADGAEGISMGQGTTYATATTAGVAALWVARYRNDPLFQRLKKEGRLTDAFRALIQKTAWVPGSAASVPPGVSCAAGATWNSNRFGHGIINAGRLLAEPIAEPPASRAAAAGEPEFPVFGSLFPDDVTPDEVASRFRRLLPAAGSSDLRPLELEVTTLYSLDAAAQQALDPVLSSLPPPDAPIAAARKALRALDISQRLMKAIGP